MRTAIRILAAALLVAAAPTTAAQAIGGATPEPAPTHGQALVASKIASNFTTLSGSQENALALVNALRNGGDVMLTTVVPGVEGAPPTTTTTTFTPPTGAMGWGNVKHSLSLAQDALVRAGVTQPTAQQLQTALLGGDIVVANADGTTTTTSLRGILTMRSEGMGWGNIAKAGGTRLGPVNSALTMGNGKLPASGVTTAAGGAAPTVKSKGITTAAGSPAANAVGKGRGVTTALGGASAGPVPKGHAYGRGIVTAGGGASVVAATAGKSPSSGAGLVTAGGDRAAAVSHAPGGSSAGSNGKGRGHGKGGKGG